MIYNLQFSVSLNLCDLSVSEVLPSVRFFRYATQEPSLLMERLFGLRTSVSGFLFSGSKINFIVLEINFQTHEYLIAEIILYFCE